MSSTTDHDSAGKSVPVSRVGQGSVKKLLRLENEIDLIISWFEGK